MVTSAHLIHKPIDYCFLSAYIHACFTTRFGVCRYHESAVAEDCKKRHAVRTG